MLFDNSLAGFNQTLAVDRDVIIRFQRVVDVLLNEVISPAGGDQQLDPLTLRLMQRFNDRGPDRFRAAGDQGAIDVQNQHFYIFHICFFVLSSVSYHTVIFIG